VVNLLWALNDWLVGESVLCGYGLCDCASLMRVCLGCITRVWQLGGCVQAVSEEFFWLRVRGEERVWVQFGAVC
jgi:hypothetical protein